MDRSTKNIIISTIHLASAIVLKHVQNELIIVDKDGNVIEGARQIAKPGSKSLGEEMLEEFKKANIDFSETVEEKMYREASEIVSNLLK